MERNLPLQLALSVQLRPGTASDAQPLKSAGFTVAAGGV